MDGRVKWQLSVQLGSWLMAVIMTCLCSASFVCWFRPQVVSPCYNQMAPALCAQSRGKEKVCAPALPVNLLRLARIRLARSGVHPATLGDVGSSRYLLLHDKPL